MWKGRDDEEARTCCSPRRQRCGDRLRHISEPIWLRSVRQHGYYNNGYYNNGYYNNGSRVGNAAAGAAIGAVGGAVAGAVLPGVSAGTGAIAGAVLGGVLGATVNGRQYYRDTRGYCYYVDQYGQPHYSYNIRC